MYSFGIGVTPPLDACCFSYICSQNQSTIAFWNEYCNQKEYVFHIDEYGYDLTSSKSSPPRKESPLVAMTCRRGAERRGEERINREMLMNRPNNT
jgi:hypothetical protein